MGLAAYYAAHGYMIALSYVIFYFTVVPVKVILCLLIWKKAGEKGYRDFRILFVAAGIFISAIAMYVILCNVKDREGKSGKEEYTSRRNTGTWKCQQCGNVNPNDSSICLLCQRHY